MKGIIAFLIGGLLTPLAAAQTDAQCMRYAVYREARGEPVKAMRAVYDVIQNRMAKFGKSCLQVVKQRGQFPWVKHGIKKVVDRSFDILYSKVLMMEAVLEEDYIFFNHKRQPWGKRTRKIGKLYFSQ